MKPNYFPALGALLFIILVFNSCKKYEEGPLFSLRSKKARIANTWMIEKLMKNGVDSTAFFADSGSEVKLEKEGGATATVIQTWQQWADTSTGTGYWELHEKDKAIALILTDDITGKVDTNWWWITKLKEDAFWLRDDDNDNDGNFDEEIHLLPVN